MGISYQCRFLQYKTNEEHLGLKVYLVSALDSYGKQFWVNALETKKKEPHRHQKKHEETDQW